jgi:ABC-type proline/glycine betaine transport system permease subunit
MGMFKLLASIATGTIGMYLLYRGKKTQNVNMMLWGGGLIVASYVVFS